MKQAGIFILVVLVLSASADAAEPTVAGDSKQFFAHVMQRIDARLAAASAARKPPLEPPKAVRVRWRARRISSVDLNAPLLDLVAADVDGDKRAELIALTSREVVVLEQRRGKLNVRTRVELAGTPASIRPRLDVGTLSIGDSDGDGVLEVHARTSRLAEGGSYTWKDGKLEPLAKGRLQGFPVCAGATADLQPGRHVFAGTSLILPAGTPVLKVPEALHGVRCRRDLVDPTGRPLAVVGMLDTSGHLAMHVWSPCGAESETCRPSAPVKRDVWYVGTAFAVADIDRDGHPDVISAANRARGDADRVSVYSSKGPRMRRVYRRAFSGGVVGVAVGDLDGDGDEEAVAAVRLLGSARIDVWVLN